MVSGEQAGSSEWEKVGNFLFGEYKVNLANSLSVLKYNLFYGDLVH